MEVEEQRTFKIENQKRIRCKYAYRNSVTKKLEIQKYQIKK